MWVPGRYGTGGTEVGVDARRATGTKHEEEICSPINCERGNANTSIIDIDLLLLEHCWNRPVTQ